MEFCGDLSLDAYENILGKPGPTSWAAVICPPLPQRVQFMTEEQGLRKASHRCSIRRSGGFVLLLMTWALVAISVATSPASLPPQAQTDWYCETDWWTKTDFEANFSRPRDARPDNFRLRIISSTVIRITGSDFQTNGNRTVVKEGSRYYFTDRVPWQTWAGTRTPVGRAYFDASNGAFRSEWDFPMIFGRARGMDSGSCE